MNKNSTLKSITVNSKSSDWDSTFQLMSWWKKEVVREAKVMVVGAGALGNEVIKNLTLLNIGYIFIVDFDIIEYSNLSRSILFRESDCNHKKCEIAAKRIKEINPNIKVQTLDGDISADVGLGIFRRMDVIIGCLDNRLARLFLNRACHKVNKTWIDGGIQNLAGQIQVFKPGKTCYECTLTKNDKKFIDARLSCPDIAQFNASYGRIATTPISSSIIGAIQAQEALKVINKDDKLQMTEDYLYYEGRTNTVLQRQYPRLKENCQSHFHYNSIIEAPLSNKMSVKEVLSWLSNNLKDEDPHILLDNELVLEITTKQSEVTSEVIISKPHLKGQLIKKYQKIPGEELVLSKREKTLSKSFPHQDITLEACGIPAFHIFQVLTEEEEFYVELSKDEGFLKF